MSLICLDNLQEPTLQQSFYHSKESWGLLKNDIENHNLTMPCCGSPAILKTDSLGTQYFDHNTKKHDCGYRQSISKEHQFVKFSICQTLIALGWQVQAQKQKVESNGEVWFTDIYATKDNAKMAIEVHWQEVPYEIMEERQALFERHGIRCVWLVRSEHKQGCNALTGELFERTKHLPVFTITKEGEGVFVVHNIYRFTPQPLNFESVTLDVKEFIQVLFSRGLKFINRESDQNYMSLELIDSTCWQCGSHITPVGRVCYHNYIYGVYTLVNKSTICEISPEHVNIINLAFQPHYHFGRLRERYSNTIEDTYMANNCPDCDALIGKFFESNDYYEKPIINTNTIRLNDTLPFMVSKAGQWILDDNYQGELSSLKNSPFNLYAVDYGFYDDDLDFDGIDNGDIEPNEF